MKKILTAIVFVLLSAAFCKAQFVTIPDPHFVTWLKSNGYSSCINVNQLDTTCSAVLNATTMDCSNTDLRSIDGVQYFKHLTSLSCEGDSLTSLPPLPSTLTYLEIGINYFKNLPAPLPPHLTDFRCYSSQLRSLPKLPSTLINLDCSGNFLDTLPHLPNGLLALSCFYDTLSVLPALPASLGTLECFHNLLTAMPTLPASLTYLDCGFNNLTSLPNFPSQLTYIDCSDNQLTSIPTLPASLGRNGSTFYCAYNPDLRCFPSYTSFTAFSDYRIDLSHTDIKCLPVKIFHSNYKPSFDSLPKCDSINPNNCDTGTIIISSVKQIDFSSQASFTIYPNPANDEVYIEGNFLAGEVELRNILCSVLIWQPVKTDARVNTIDVSHLTQGIYFISLHSGNQNISWRIIKE